MVLCGCAISQVKNHGPTSSEWRPLETLRRDRGLCLVAMHQRVSVDACETHPRQREVQREVVLIDWVDREE